MIDPKKPIDIVMMSMSPAYEWPKFHAVSDHSFVSRLPLVSSAAVYQGVANRNFFVLDELRKYAGVRNILSVDFVFPSLKRRMKEFLLADIWRRTEHTFYKHPFYKVEKFDTVYTYSGISYRFLPAVLRHLHFANTLLWVYNPLVASDALRLPHAGSVFDAVDDWRHHSAYEHSEHLLTQQYAVIDQKFENIFTVSDQLRSVFPNNSHVSWVPNGVDVAHFTEPRDIPLDLQNIPRPWLGYHGVIQDRLDADMLFSLAAQHPEWSFVFVGLVWPSAHLEKLRSLSNVYFLGQKDYHDIPAYVQHFDVGLIPHKRNAFTASMNPLKIYEYLACGLPVVTTPVAGTENFSEILQIATDASSFERAIVTSLQEDGERFVALRKNSVLEHTWAARVARMMEFLTA